MAKLADAPDLGSGGEILRGSNPLPGMSPLWQNSRDKSVRNSLPALPSAPLEHLPVWFPGFVCFNLDKLRFASLATPLQRHAATGLSQKYCRWAGFF